MDFVFCGIIDIIIVVTFVLTLFIGYKKGFIEHFLNLANGLCGFFFSLFFCRGFADFLIKNNVFYGSIKDKISGNLNNSEIVVNGVNNTASSLLESVGIPKNLSEMLAKNINVDQAMLVDTLSSKMSSIIMVVISFLLLFFGSTILCLVLKLIFRALKEGSSLLRITDGIVGLLFYAICYIVIINILLFGVSIMVQTMSNSVTDFFIVDMQLQSDKFRLSKYLYDHNLITNIVGILF